MVPVRKKLYLVVLGENDHGKGHIVRSMIRASSLNESDNSRKGRRRLPNPKGTIIRSYVFPRSFQETEKDDYHEPTPKARIEACLNANDPNWKSKDLIVMPSHIMEAATEAMISVAHSWGFQAACAYVNLYDDDLKSFGETLSQEWDERWEIKNLQDDDNWEHQCRELGFRLFWRISKYLVA